MNPSDVAARLRWLVDVSGKSANALSELAGLDRTYLRLILTGQRTAFGAAPMTALAQVFGVDLDWLLLGTGPQPSEESVRDAAERAKTAVDQRPSATGTEG